MMPAALDVGARCYTIAEVLDKLQMSPRTFRRLKGARALPFLEEIRPRLGRHVRYRADLVDKYLRGDWPTIERPRLLARRAR